MRRTIRNEVANAERIRSSLSTLGFAGLFQEESLDDCTIVFERTVAERDDGMPHVLAIVAKPDRIECSLHSPIRILAPKQADFARRFILPINRAARNGRLDLGLQGNYVYHVGIPVDYVSDFTGYLNDAIGEVMSVLIRFGGKMIAFACE